MKVIHTEDRLITEPSELVDGARLEAEERPVEIKTVVETEKLKGTVITKTVSVDEYVQKLNRTCADCKWFNVELAQEEFKMLDNSLYELDPRKKALGQVRQMLSAEGNEIQFVKGGQLTDKTTEEILKQMGRCIAHTTPQESFIVHATQELCPGNVGLLFEVKSQEDERRAQQEKDSILRTAAALK